MNGKKAKALRRMARQELNLRPDELLVHEHTVNGRGGKKRVQQIINEPHSAHQMAEQLKKAYKQAAAKGSFKNPGTLAEQKAAEDAA